MAKCKKCPIQDECKRLNEWIRKESKSYKKLTLCPLRVLVDDVFRYSRRVEEGKA